MFYKKLFILLFVFKAISCENIEIITFGQDQDTKSLISIAEKKSISLFNNTINLMYKCDKYEDFWKYRKKNLSLYLLSSGKNVFKARRDALAEINRKLEFLEKKKFEYAVFAGNIYKIAEVFIEKMHFEIKDSEVNNFLNEFTLKLNSFLPENYSDSYFIDERKELKKLMPDNKKQELRKKYYMAGAATIVALFLLVKYRKNFINFAGNFWSNQIVKPICSLNDWFFSGLGLDENFNLTPEEILRDLENKSYLIRDKNLDIFDSNKITMIMASFMPIALVGFGAYKVFDKTYSVYSGIPKKTLDIDNMMLKISAIINKNIGKVIFEAQDQGLLCYFVHRCKKSLDVVPEHLRSNIEADLSYISSSLNNMDEKMHILQSLKIMLYVR